MSKSTKILVGIALAGLGAWACGPFFGISVMNSRKATVLAEPAFDYHKQLETLVPKPAEKLPPPTADLFVSMRAGETVEGFTLEQKAGGIEGHEKLVEATRAAPTGSAAYQTGAGLPEAIRRYAAGAVSFRLADWSGAAAHFQAVTKLTAAESRPRIVMALYMLGRVAKTNGDAKQASAYFAQTRAAVAAGAPDPFGLAIDSFGEEARAVWDHAGDRVAAMRLYATQAAYGSESGRLSVSMLAKEILENPALLDKNIHDDLTRRALLLRLNAYPNEDHRKALLAALERQNIQVTSGAGLLAATVYGAGQFDEAARWAAREKSAASAWVQAKLAWRQGDEAAALREYESALAALKSGNPDLVEPDKLDTELAILRLRRGDFVQALDLFYRHTKDPWGDYWLDAAYIAERLLTTAELRQYVDANVKTPPNWKPPAKDSYDPVPAAVAFRALLGRRLMREGNFDAALAYFDNPEIRLHARDYGAARARAVSVWRSAATRAEAWREAGRLARWHGLEILGYEHTPDFAAFGGSYVPYYYEEPAGKDDKKEFPLTAEEAKRAAATAPPATRWHYRLTAVHHALEAAKLIPARSEGYAATLCEATGWVIDREPKKAAELYGLYQRTGAYVPWGKTFGRQCPAVALEGDWQFRSRLQLRRVERKLGSGGVLALSAMGAVALIGGPIVWLRRRSVSA